MRRPWSSDVEGSAVVAAAMVALLVYGALNENIFALRGATVPALALLLALLLAVLDIAVRSAGLRQSLEEPLPLVQIVVGTLACSVFALGLIHVGLVVSTAIGLSICTSVIRRRVQLSVIAISIITAAFMWLIFAQFGHVFFGDPWLF